MLVAPTNINNHELGARQYECSNHLGNVLAVISDKKIPRDDNTDLIIDYYEPAVLNTFDYSPFGVLLEERNHTAQVCEEAMLFALQNDFEDGTEQGYSPMSSSVQLGNSSNRLSIEKSGGGGAVGATQTFVVENGTMYNFVAEVDKGSCNPASSIDVRIKNDLDVVIASTNVSASGVTTVTLSFTATSTANYSVEFERVGNNSNCEFYVDNIAIDYLGEVCMDYSTYRYEFNGMERDDEVKGKGNSYDLGLRNFDPRLARMLSLDPRTSEYSWQSPYVYHRNTPIQSIDYLGGGDDDKQKVKKYSHPDKGAFKKAKEKALADWKETYNEYRDYYISIGKLSKDASKAEAFKVFSDANVEELKRLSSTYKKNKALYENAESLEQKWNKLDTDIEDVVHEFNQKKGLTGDDRLDPNLVKALMFSESEMGTGVAYKKLVDGANPGDGSFSQGAVWQINLGRVTDYSVYEKVVKEFGIPINWKTNYKAMGNRNDVMLAAGALMLKYDYAKKVKGKNPNDLNGTDWFNAVVAFKGVSGEGNAKAQLVWKLYTTGAHPYTSGKKLF